MAVLESTFIYDRPVSGKDYIPRRAEENTLREILGSGDNVLLCSPPKTGKSSLLAHVLQNMRKEGEPVLYYGFSLLGVRTERGLCKAFGVEASDIESALSLPYAISREKSCKTVVEVQEFQNILLCEDSVKLLNAFEKAVKTGDGDCRWVWSGSMTNALDSIFSREHRFAGHYKRLFLQPIPYRDIESHIIRGFQTSGKDIGRELIRGICDDLRGDICHISHVAAICDGLSRGYITKNTVSEAMLSLVKIHEPTFMFTTNSLSYFQLSLLKATLDGESNFSSEKNISRYGLNSSANVKRVKDALCKKEIICFPRGERNGAVIINPLFEYWLRHYFFA